MNAHTAGDLEAAEVEAADLLALARLDDDGAPCPGVVPWAQPCSTGPDNDRDPGVSRGSAAAADDRARGQRRARRAGFSRPERGAARHNTRRIAARPGRRRRLTPATIGVG
jgi:hypothetical protein